MLRSALFCLLVVSACRSGGSPAEPPAPAAAAPTPAVEAAPPVVAAKPVEEKATMDDCNVEAFVIDPDPAGLNVREGSSAGSKVVGNIAHDPDGTVLEVISSGNDWLRVRRATPIEKEPYDVEGWVSGRMTATSVRCPDENPAADCTVALRAGASDSETEVRRLPVEAQVKVVGCKGKWVQVETTEAARNQRARGWLAPAAQCPNPVTTCP